MANKPTEKAIFLPFSIDSYGSVSSTTDQTKIWADKVRSVVGTALGERVMRPEFGTDVVSGLYSGMSTASEAVRRNVYAAFAKYLPVLSLENVVVTVVDDSQMSVEITYGLPNQIEVTTTVGVAYVQGTAPIYEELA